MIWVILALIAAVALGITEILTKKAYRHFDPWAISWARNVFALPIFYSLLFVDSIPTIDPVFWKLLLVAAPLELLVGTLFFFAIKLTPLSLVLPFTIFSTIFISFGAYFINGEPLKPIYFLAFSLILLGAFFIQEKRTINLRQLHTQKSELGILLMTVTTLLFGVTVPIGDRMADASSPYFYVAVNFTVFVLLFTPIFLRRTKVTLPHIKKNLPELVVIGIVNGVFLASLWVAFSHGPAGPVSAIKDLSIFVAIVLAGTFLKEQGMVRRLSASAVMITGAALAILG